MLKTVTKTVYTCDKCGKELLTPFIVRGCVKKQRSYEFEFHFCNECFSEMTSAFSANLTIGNREEP